MPVMKKTLCLSAVMLLMTAGCAVKTDMPSAGGKYSDVYETTEILDDEAYDSYMHDDGEYFVRLKAFTEYLQSSPDLEFYPFSQNLIEVTGTDIPDACLVNHGTEFEENSRYEIDGESACAAEAIQISDHYFDLFPLELSQGRTFTEADFQYMDSQTVPVILGSAYSGTFHLGDTFEAYYIFEKLTFEVIGIAAGGSTFYCKAENRMAAYDRYIIMPFAEIRTDSFFSRAVLLQKTCGFIACSEGREKAVEVYHDCLSKAGLAEWAGMMGINERSLQEKLDKSLSNRQP